MQENSLKTNIIKLRFIRNGQPQGIAKGIVTQVNVPEEEIAPFKDRAKSIIGKAQVEEVAAQ